MRSAGILILILLAALSLAAWLPAPEGGGDGDTAAKSPGVRIHPDPEALTEVFLQAAHAAVLEDTGSLRVALDRIRERSVRIQDMSGDPYPGALRNIDQAFHMAIDVAAEYAGEGNARQAFDQYQHVQRGCWLCHAVAREKGLLPASDDPGVNDGAPPESPR